MDTREFRPGFQTRRVIAFQLDSDSTLRGRLLEMIHNSEIDNPAQLNPTASLCRMPDHKDRTDN